MDTKWATEQEALDFYKIVLEEHCPSCHGSDEEAMSEVELPDGRTATVCCDARHAIELAQQQWDK